MLLLLCLSSAELITVNATGTVLKPYRGTNSLIYRRSDCYGLRGSLKAHWDQILQWDLPVHVESHWNQEYFIWVQGPILVDSSAGSVLYLIWIWEIPLEVRGSFPIEKCIEIPTKVGPRMKCISFQQSVLAFFADHCLIKYTSFESICRGPSACF